MNNFKDAINDFLVDNPEFGQDAFHGEVWGDFFDTGVVSYGVKEGDGGKTYTDRSHVIFTDGTEAICVDNNGGEGFGRDVTWKFTNSGEEVFVTFYGWYESHYGLEYEGYRFVTPKEKTVTVYV